MNRVFKRLGTCIAALALLAGCGAASQVKIEGPKSGDLPEGTSLVYTLDHKTHVHGQKVADALRILPSEVTFEFKTAKQDRLEKWVSKLTYYTVSESDVDGVEEVVSQNVFNEGGELFTKAITAKCGEDEVEIGVASKCEKLGSSNNTYGYTHFEIDASWIDSHFLDTLSVNWNKAGVSLKAFRYTRVVAEPSKTVSLEESSEEMSENSSEEESYSTDLSSEEVSENSSEEELYSIDVSSEEMSENELYSTDASNEEVSESSEEMLESSEESEE